MKEADPKALDAAADAAADGEMTDEQVWNEMLDERKGAAEDDPDADAPDDDTPDGDDDKGEEDKTDDGPADDAQDPPDDPDPSDDDKGAADDGNAEDQDPKELLSQIERLKHSLKSEQGRTAASQRQIADLTSEIGDLKERIDSTKDKTDTTALDTAREEFPDIIGPAVDQLKALEARADQLSAADQRRLERLTERVKELSAEETSIVLAEHPEGLGFIAENRDAFNAWVEDQRKEIRDIRKANGERIVNGTGVALMLSEFKQSLLPEQGPDPEPKTETKPDPQAAKRKLQRSGAQAVKSDGRKPVTSELPDDADGEAIWNSMASKRARERART